MSKTSQLADDLFLSEDDSPSVGVPETISEAVSVQVPSKKKRSRLPTAAPSTSRQSKYKKPRINPAKMPNLPTAAELFGSDDSEDEDQPSTSSAPRVERLNIASAYEIIMRCDKCLLEIPKHKFKYHMRTNLHKSNCLLRTEFDNIKIIATAFKNRIVTYRLSPAQEIDYLTPEAFLNDSQSDIRKVIEISLEKHNCIKINLELFAYFLLAKTNEQLMKSFNTKLIVIYKNSDLNDFHKNSIEVLKRKLTEFEQRDSGWSFFTLSHLEININKYNPMRGGTFIELPPAIKNKKCCLNIQNNDDHCFLWSIIAALYPVKHNPCRISSYPHYSTVLNTQGMSFPPSMNDIKLFEKYNPSISINIYGLDSKCTITGPLYLTNTKKKHHINLLYIERYDKGHYCLIKHLVRLVRNQISYHKGKIHFCDSCLQFFSSELKYSTHHCTNVLTILPEINSMIQFKNYERQQKINFIIYADFESMLQNYSEQNTENHNTRKFKLHVPACFAYYICCSYDPSLNKYVTYRGPDCVETFISWLVKDVTWINNILSEVKPMKPLTHEQKTSFENATECFICKELLFGDKVRDHDHVTSEYRGAAHSLCNLKYKMCQFVPIVFHNLAGYDSHLFIKELAKYKGRIKIIAKSKENYTSITKFIQPKNTARPIQMKFIDSYQFLSSSLDELSKSLDFNDFINLSSVITDKEALHLLKHKGVYPYDYMDSWSKYEDEQLPPKEYFYNSIKLEHISDDDYRHAQAVWQAFNIHTLGEYTDLYLKCDVFLLCDIFENFRNTSLQHYSLDPAYYISAPSLSWDAMLLYTGVRLELISDLEIYQLLEKGIRGGLAQCSVRHAKANNKYVPHFDDTKPCSYIIYLDCNNLYGYAMTRKLPISEFIFLSQSDLLNFDVMKIPNDGEYGYILEVDLEYPDYLHNIHKDLPFACEKFIPPNGKSVKLIANLYDKYKYVIHFVNLKECLHHGLILKKIHRILRFRQESFLRKYIDLNTCLRQASKSPFERDFFKLLNNSVFGKTIENKRKQVDVKLLTKWKDFSNTTNKCIGAEKIISKPNLKSISIFSENFVAAQLSPEKLILDKPIYIGFTVLELAKQHLYNFHYGYIKNKYGNDVNLCYTDTDSLLYLINTDDFYKDLKNDISRFDTSNFRQDNPFGIPKINASIPGLFKDELGGSIITEFVGLRAKLYCLKSVKTTIKKAKGVTKPITKRLKMLDYYETLVDNKVIKRKMNMIKSIKHLLYSQKVNKVVLNSNDDKRQILANQIETLPWGHCDTLF